MQSRLLRTHVKSISTFNTSLTKTLQASRHRPQLTSKLFKGPHQACHDLCSPFLPLWPHLPPHRSASNSSALLEVSLTLFFLSGYLCSHWFFWVKWISTGSPSIFSGFYASFRSSAKVLSPPGSLPWISDSNQSLLLTVVWLTPTGHSGATKSISDQWCFHVNSSLANGSHSVSLKSHWNYFDASLLQNFSCAQLRLKLTLLSLFREYVTSRNKAEL